jgi:hypothetical protein
LVNLLDAATNGTIRLGGCEITAGCLEETDELKFNLARLPTVCLSGFFFFLHDPAGGDAKSQLVLHGKF